MGDFTYVENADRANGNGRTPLTNVSGEVSRSRNTGSHRIFLRLHRQLRETRSFHVTKQDADRRRAVRSPNLEEIILNIVAIDPSPIQKAGAYHVNVAVFRVLNKNRLHLFYFQRVQALNPAGCLLRLSVGGTEINVHCIRTS
ncbi:hypothetical protein TNCV_3550141 [Trichonephila clavipes]|nr:hypothetical protein TNCV_3550141 [Trichonephila clavipes]